MELSSQSLACAFGGAINCGKQIRMNLLDYDDTGWGQADGHSATLVRSPAGPVDIRNPDGDTADPNLKSAQAKMQPPRDVAIDFLGKVNFLNSNVQSYDASRRSFPLKATLARTLPTKKVENAAGVVP